MADFIAVLDIGKTHTKLLLVDVHDGATVEQFQRASIPLQTALGIELDVQGIEYWLRTTLASSKFRHQVRAIVPIAHGASAVLLDTAGTVIAAPDYENPRFEEVANDYRTLRDAFSLTYSPFLPLGLNLGRQLYWLQTRAPQLFRRCDRILTYAQYWSYRLSGIASCELTSLGCHTDLWCPLKNEYSPLANQQGWSQRCATVRHASDILGAVTSEWARSCELDPDCRVICGIHDSNASYLAQALTQAVGQPFTAISSGTWTVLMARGTDLQRLVETRDMLANVDAFGQPVATARFPGGREFAAIAGPAVDHVPTLEHLQVLLERNVMALPCFSATGGPFAGHRGQLHGADSLSSPERAALATLYVALMTDYLLDELGVSGALVVDGPLANNTLYTGILASLRPKQTVQSSDARTGLSQAARYLAGYPNTAVLGKLSPAFPASPAIQDYAHQWRQRLPS